MSIKSYLLTVGILFTFCQVGNALDVTINSRIPYEHVDATGQVDGANMTTPGSKYSFVRMQNGKVVLVDPAGGNILVDLSATDYVPPAAAATPAPIVKTPPRPSPSPVPTQVPALDSETTKVNHALGMPLFDEGNLWQEKAADVGQRLGWKQDSISSYRLYDDRPALSLHMAASDDLDSSDPNAATITDNHATPAPDPSVTTDLLGRSLINFLGSHSYCSTLYSRNGKPDFVSIIFANNGDLYESTQRIHFTENDVSKIIARDAKALQRVLVGALGDFTESGFGASSDVRQPAKRWDWKGTSFLLINIPGRYVGVVICPTDFADAHGIRSDRDSNAVRDALPNHVKNNPNGDIYIEGIPYVDQGEKGYSLPGCWERYLRYMDIPSDMYFFATAGDQKFGGEVNPGAFRGALTDYLESYQTHIEMLSSPVTLDLVSKEIDSGHPIMWMSHVVKDVEEDQFNRSKLRESGDWKTYLAQLNLDQGKLSYMNISGRTCYMRLIVGYNAKTNEIAVSDCFMKGVLRWFSVDEARKIDFGDSTVLQ